MSFSGIYWFCHLHVQQYGVKNLDLPCLASGHNSSLTSEDMADLWCQEITVDGNSKPAPKKEKPYHNWRRRTVGDRKESFAQGDKKIYATPMLISINIFVKR